MLKLALGSALLGAASWEEADIELLVVEGGSACNAHAVDGVPEVGGGKDNVGGSNILDNADSDHDVHDGDGDAGDAQQVVQDALVVDSTLFH